MIRDRHQTIFAALLLLMLLLGRGDDAGICIALAFYFMP